MSRFSCGHLWLVNFDPSFGHEYQKARPGLIIESDRYIPRGKLLTIIPLSSRIEKPSELDVLIEKDADNRLMFDSLVKTKQIASFDKRRFMKRIGLVDSETIARVEANVRSFLFNTPFL